MFADDCRVSVNMFVVDNCFTLHKRDSQSSQDLEMCAKVIHIKLQLFKFVPDHFKTQDMCAEEVHIKSHLLEHVSHQFKTNETCKVLHIMPTSSF